jgi:hypothetical protein
MDNHHWVYRWSDCQVYYARGTKMSRRDYFDRHFGNCRRVRRYLPWSVVGWYKAGESAGFFGGVVSAVIILFVYGLIAGRPGRA